MSTPSRLQKRCSSRPPKPSLGATRDSSPELVDRGAPNHLFFRALHPGFDAPRVGRLVDERYSRAAARVNIAHICIHVRCPDRARVCAAKPHAQVVERVSTTTWNDAI